jgi:NADH-quinone oxidoreductase subunit A
VLSDYLPIVILLALATVFAVGSIGVASRVGPRNPSPAKDAPYECGITPERLPSERFPVKFYLVAMLFIIFDVEVVFFYPWAVIFRELRLFGLAEMGVFVGFLLVAYVYIVRRGGLDWEEESAMIRRAFGRGIERSLLRGPGEGGAPLPERERVGA